MPLIRQSQRSCHSIPPSLGHMSTLETWLMTSPMTVITHLMSFFSVRRLHAIRRTSKSLRLIFDAYATVAWDLNLRLKPWFSDVAGFRRTLHETNGIISGSQALQFFDREHYSDSDMDIFMRAGGVETMCTWLTHHSYVYEEDYPVYPRGVMKEKLFTLSSRAIESTSNTNRPLLGVFNFVKRGRDVKKQEVFYHVQVIAVDIDPINYVLFEFHSSECLYTLFF